MERLGDDVLGLVLQRVPDWRDRKACSEVCRQWARVEGLTRAALRILEPGSLPRFLPRFPNLSTIETNRMISDSDLAFVARTCTHLRALNLGIHRRPFGGSERSWRYDAGDAGLRAVSAGCRHLAKVSLRRRKRVGDFGVVALVKSLKDLTFLDLSWCSRVSDVALRAMADMSCLSVLLLHGCSLVTDTGLASLASGSPSITLKRLDLSECDQITDDGVCSLHRMSSLQELGLAECGPRVTDMGALAIAGIHSLRKLDLSWLINLSDVALFALAQNCRNLVEINATGCELVTGAGIRSFSSHRSLEILVFASCYNVCADDIEQLVLGCKSLRYLGLERTLRAWMSPSLQEKLSGWCRIDWL